MSLEIENFGISDEALDNFREFMEMVIAVELPAYLTLTGLALARYGQIALRLPEVILEANNQNRYCTMHQYLPPGPLINFLSCLVLSPGVAIVPQIDDSLTKNCHEAA